jgi:hypothetical protein
MRLKLIAPEGSAGRMGPLSAGIYVPASTVGDERI